MITPSTELKSNAMLIHHLLSGMDSTKRLDLSLRASLVNRPATKLSSPGYTNCSESGYAKVIPITPDCFTLGKVYRYLVISYKTSFISVQYIVF